MSAEGRYGSVGVWVRSTTACPAPPILPYLPTSLLRSGGYYGGADTDARAISKQGLWRLARQERGGHAGQSSGRAQRAAQPYFLRSDSRTGGLERRPGLPARLADRDPPTWP